MSKAIYFDMDGTLANLYGIENWLEKLSSNDVTPYEQAEVMLNMQSLAHRLNTLQKNGYTIGIISWLSKTGSSEYQAEIKEAKLAWLSKHLHSVQFDEIHIEPYGRKKHLCANIKNGYIFDDDPAVRKAWIKNNPEGWAFSEKCILETLELLK